MSAEQIIEDARGYASEQLALASAVMKEASSTIGGIGYLMPYANVDVPDFTLKAPSVTAPPTLSDLGEFNAGNEPTVQLEMSSIPALNVASMPSSTAVAPSLQDYAPPQVLAAQAPQAPSIRTSFVFPELPDELRSLNVEAPVIGERAEPVKPQLQLSVFDKAVPAADFQGLTNLPERVQEVLREAVPGLVAVLDDQVDALIRRYNPQYHSQMAAIEAQLARLMEGGTGMSPAVEAALLERAKDRDLGEYARVRETAWAEAANRGFTLPGGSLLSAITQARQGAANNIARANSDIVIKQAELEQQNLQFAITTSTGLRTTILNAALSYHQNLIQINGQALEQAKMVGGFMVQQFNTLREAYAAKLDEWKAEVALYESKLKRDTMLIELFQREIDALRAMTQIDELKLSQYQKRIDALQALGNVYRLRIDAVLGEANLERLKLDMFGSQVQSYGVQVQAKGQEFQAYRAAQEGQEMKVRMYLGQISADNQKLEGWRTSISAQAEQIRAVATSNDAQARQFDAAWRGFSASVGAKSEAYRARVEGSRLKLNAYQLQTQAEVSYAQMATGYYKARSDVAVSKAELSMRAQQLQADSMSRMQTSIAHVANTNAGIYSSVASMALSGLNSIALKED